MVLGHTTRRALLPVVLLGVMLAWSSAPLAP
jgi:hypothetical protein